MLISSTSRIYRTNTYYNAVALNGYFEKDSEKFFKFLISFFKRLPLLQELPCNNHRCNKRLLRFRH